MERLPPFPPKGGLLRRRGAGKQQREAQLMLYMRALLQARCPSLPACPSFPWRDLAALGLHDNGTVIVIVIVPPSLSYSNIMQRSGARVDYPLGGG